MARREIPTLRRRKGVIAAKRKFFLFCEGLNTEPAYFIALKRIFPGTIIEIKPVGGEPKAVADGAVYEKKRGKKSD